MGNHLRPFYFLDVHPGSACKEATMHCFENIFMESITNNACSYALFICGINKYIVPVYFYPKIPGGGKMRQGVAQAASQLPKTPIYCAHRILAATALKTFIHDHPA